MYAGCTRLLIVYTHLRFVCGYVMLPCNAYYDHVGINANTVYPVLAVMLKLVQSGIDSIGLYRMYYAFFIMFGFFICMYLNCLLERCTSLGHYNTRKIVINIILCSNHVGHMIKRARIFTYTCITGVVLQQPQPTPFLRYVQY